MKTNVFPSQTKLVFVNVYDTNIIMTPRELIQSVGGPTRLARALNRSHTAVILWKKIPPHHILTIERKFGIPREELRPDLYPPRRVRRRAHPTPTQHQKETRV